MKEGGIQMTDGPIIQGNAVVFLRARQITGNGRDHDTEMRHIASQRELCRRAAEQMEVVILKEYVEHGGTGPVSSRPILRQMFDELRTLLGVRYVLVASIDRLARMSSDLATIQEAIRAVGTHLVVAADPPKTYPC
jgi:DNA invertase Pin-like site-specific DNA recombinase